MVPAAPPASFWHSRLPEASVVNVPRLSKPEQFNSEPLADNWIVPADVRLKLCPAPVVEIVKLPGFVTVGVVTPVKVGDELAGEIAPQVPPAPRMIVLPPPVRLPVPLGQTNVLLP